MRQWENGTFPLVATVRMLLNWENVSEVGKHYRAVTVGKLLDLQGPRAFPQTVSERKLTEQQGPRQIPLVATVGRLTQLLESGPPLTAIDVRPIQIEVGLFPCDDRAVG